jgi:sugar phosphate isomerase/epimerase
MPALGLMLYSVRDACDADLPGTLQAVAEMGYEGVELFSLHGHPAERVRRWLDWSGLRVAGRHASLPALEDELEALAAEARTLGTSRLTLSWIEPPATVAAAEAALDRLARVADEAGPLGVELGFHNHDAEVRALEDGSTFLDRALALDVFLELDLGWIWWAGRDPVEVLDAARGRVPLVHVKDFAQPGVRRFCALGEGAIDYGRILPAAADADWLLVEQDEAEGSELDAAARSLDALRRLVAAA